MGTAGLDLLSGFFHRAPEDTADLADAMPGFEPLPDDEQPGEITQGIPATRDASQVSFWRQLADGARHTWRAARRAARESHEREGSFLQQRKAEQHSYDLLCEYADSRAWVPEGHAGGIFERLGDMYFVIGKRKAAYHLAQLYKCERPLRQSTWWLVKYLVVVGLLLVTHRGVLAAGITAAVVLVIVVAVFAARPRRPAPNPETDPSPDEEGEAGDLS